MSLQQQPLTSGDPPIQRQQLSFLQGPIDPPLVDFTLGELLDLQCQHHGTQECIVIPWTGARWTYNELNHHSRLLARALLGMGIGTGDRVGIMAGNCEQYAAVFFAVARVGAILVILNNTYTATEAQYALQFTECKLFFTTRKIGRISNVPLLQALESHHVDSPPTPKVIIIRGEGSTYETYDKLLCAAQKQDPTRLRRAEMKVLPYSVCNLQFTSGTTGRPKAAMLTHHNLVNNSRFIGDRMRLSPADTLCCPPPLFHCFGLVLGLLASITHGARIVFPAETFDAAATLRAVRAEACTALHGVPAMFEAVLALPEAAALGQGGGDGEGGGGGERGLRLRTGIVAGAPVPRSLMERMVRALGMREFTSSYGLTEASPTCFNAFTDDAVGRRLATVGTLMPHAQAKIVGRDGAVVPVGERGELCMAGYQLQAGYWNNSERTEEVMVRDEEGVLWLRTGDEAVFDERGYCSITGRFKDIIIRGGENIYPLEVEERLTAHPAVSAAVVVGIQSKRYGEVVGAFLKADSGQFPGDGELREWVKRQLGAHKAPEHIFWLGQGDIPAEVPLTGSGKVKKFAMSELGNRLVEEKSTSKL